MTFLLDEGLPTDPTHWPRPVATTLKPKQPGCGPRSGATLSPAGLLRDWQFDTRWRYIYLFPGREGQRDPGPALAGFARDSHGAPKTHVSFTVPHLGPR